MAPIFTYTFGGFGSLSADYTQAGVGGSFQFPPAIPPQQQQEEQLPPPPPSPVPTETSTSSSSTSSVSTLNSDQSTVLLTPQSPQSPMNEED